MIVICDCYSIVKLGIIFYLIGFSWVVLWYYRGFRVYVFLRIYFFNFCVVFGGGRGIDIFCVVVFWVVVFRRGC